PGLGARPSVALAAGLVAVLGVGGPAAIRDHDALRRRYAAPEPQDVLLAALEPHLAANLAVVELAIPFPSRLLLPSDPWADLGRPPPSDALRAAANDWLAASHLLPTSLLFNHVIAASPTLAQLRQKLRESRIDAVLLVVPTAQLLMGHGIQPTPHDEALRA